MSCPHRAGLTSDELGALDWLSRVLKSMVDKDGPNAGRALLAAKGLARVQEALERLHDQAHALDTIVKLLRDAGTITIDGVNVDDILFGEAAEIRPAAKA